MQCLQVKHYIAKCNTSELIFLIPTRTHEQTLFFYVYRANKYEGGVGRETRPSSVARVSRFPLAFAHLNPREKKYRLFCKVRVYKRKIRLKHSRISPNHIVLLIKLLPITITRILF